MGRINGLQGSALGSEAFSQDRPESVTTVADGQQSDHVFGTAASPALGDGGGCSRGGQGAFELVGYDEDAERHRPEAWPAWGLLGKLANGGTSQR
jgi:hypothetical protein